jgi:asparagine synthase (glutamine-hydrolysing)
MCGIAGVIGQADDALLRAMVARLRHRGPDDQGTALCGSAGLACARLSLLDFEKGAQPFHGDGSGLIAAFNGEIYNHAALRAELRSRHGCTFRSRSDTEVVLRGFECEGVSFFSRLEGMFAVAITDGRTLWLARDSFGMKPLFYWLSNDRRRCLFASEAKALFAHGSVPRAIDRTAVVEFATFGFPLDGHSLFESVTQLGPGDVLEIEQQADGRLAVRRHRFAIAGPRAFDGREDDAVEAVGAALRESVREQLAADHPVACFVSGGIDSAIVAQLARGAARGVTFTAGDVSDSSTFDLAEQVAAHANAAHHIVHLDPAAYIASVPRAIAAAELPFGPTIAFSCAPSVRRATKAALCGDGADELFGGYGLHVDPDQAILRYASALRHVTASGVMDRQAIESSAAVVDWLQAGTVDARRQRVDEFLRGDQLTNYHVWLWDRGSMASGVEVRLPFLNTRLRALAASLPMEWRVRDGVTKVPLRRLVSRLLPPAIAAAVADQPKRAAWHAGRHCLRAWEQLALELMPAEARRSHPFGAVFPFAPSLLLFDLFLIVFFIYGGVVPDGLAPDRLYREHRQELAAMHTALR